MSEDVSGAWKEERKNLPSLRKPLSWTTVFGPGHPGRLFQLKAEDIERGGASEHLSSLVTLIYVEGIKYTFGNKYISRSSQGEFVSLKHWTKYDGNYLNIHCKEDGLWISTHDVQDLCDSSIILVNGDPVSRGHERALVFGDILSIFVSGDILDLLFQPTTTASSTQTIENDVTDGETNETNPLTNPLIAQNILHFLPTTLIKEFRHICKLWNVEGLMSLRNRIILRPFNLPLNIDVDDTNAALLMQISTFAHSQLNYLKFPHWKIRLADGNLEKQTMDDIIWLFDPAFHTRRIQTLEYGTLLRPENGCGVLQAVLDGVKDTIESLILKLFIVGVDFEPLSGIHFPRLKSIQLDLLLGCKDDVSPLRPFVKSIVLAANCTQNLTLEVSPVIFKLSETIPSSIIMEEMADSGFSNLTTIKFNFKIKYDAKHFLPLASLRVGGLKKLQLTSLFYQPIDLRQVLQAHTESLEELVLHFNGPFILSNNVNINVYLPKRMSKLKDLSVFIYQEDRVRTSFRLHVGQSDDVADMRIDNPRHFPSLSSLTVWPVSGCDDSVELYEKISTGVTWGLFWPTLLEFVGTNDPFPSICNLDIPFVLDGMYHPGLVNLEMRFPNMIFPPSLEEARLGPVWTDI